MDNLRLEHTSQEPINEIIVKELFGLADDDTGERLIAVPETLILATSDGFEHLARHFQEMAEWCRQHASFQLSKGAVDPEDVDPDDCMRYDPGSLFNLTLSDHIVWRFGMLNHLNRPAIFNKYSISPDAAKRNCLTKRYRDLITRVEEVLERESRYM